MGGKHSWKRHPDVFCNFSSSRGEVRILSWNGQHLYGKRMVAIVQNARLIRLLTAWAEELGLELIVRVRPTEETRRPAVRIFSHRRR